MKHHLEENTSLDPIGYEMVTWDQRDLEREKDKDLSSELDRLSHLRDISQ